MAKVGRPSVIEEEYYKILKMTYPDIKTRRGLMNKKYSLKAFRII